MKRLFDIVASGLGLIVLSPLFLALAVWIKLDSKGPVFYRQVRVGRYNKDFRIFKFRSMRVGADKGSLVTIGGHDPRVTRSGYFIRKFSIPPSIRVFPNESTLCMRWPKYWSFSFSIISSKEHPGLISFRMDWLDLLAVHGTLKSLLQHHSSKASILWRSA